MWLDRFSGHSTPSASPPPHQNRPLPRRPSHLAPAPGPYRSGFSPRTSSLSLASNASTTSLTGTGRLPNGSNLRHKANIAPPADIPDPLRVLEEVVGAPLSSKRSGQKDGLDSEPVDRPTDVVEKVDFQGISLHEFANEQNAKVARAGAAALNASSIAEYEKEKDKFEDLHRSINACDDVLKSVETYLTSFQKDLGAVSAEIETLQNRSTTLNTRLENRKKVEKHLGPAVEEFSISPALVRKISDGPIDVAWMKALEEVEKRCKAIEARPKEGTQVKAVEDSKPLLENLTNRALERIRDHVVAQIKALRSPNINAQIIQQQAFLKYKDLYAFLARHNLQVAEELGQAYINTIRWYYLNQFTRYHKALEKIRIHVVDKYEVLGQDEPGRRSNIVHGGKTGIAPHDAFNLGRRIDLLKTTSQSALSSYLAEEDKSTHYLEVPFRNFNIALLDNASAEYSFLTTFFAHNSFHQLSRKFSVIFEPTFALGQALTKHLIDPTFDGLGVLLCVRLNQHFAFELQRRKIPAMDPYINATTMLLWPRFQIVMDQHCESVKHLAASVSGRSAASAFSLTATDSARQSAAPHFLTQRFGQFLQGILALSSEAGDDEPVFSSLSRLRVEYEAFLAKMAKGINEQRKKERFLHNNYSLVLTIIGDTSGRLAEEQIKHFEALKLATSIDEK